MRTAVAGGGARDAGRHRRRGGAELSVAAGHHDRAVRGRRHHRHRRAPRGRAHEGVARPAGDRRERDRRRRHHRDHPPVPLGARRLHARHRPVDVARRRRRDVRAAVRHAEGFRAGVDALDRSALDRRAQGLSGQGSAGADRLAQGEPRQGVGRHHRARQRGAYVPGLFPEHDRHPLPVRALSRRRAGDAGPAGRADRPVLSGGRADAVAISQPAASRPMRC